MWEQDLMIILSWWLTWFLVGIGSLPLTSRWLRGLWDEGYGFAKVVGWVVVGYGVWLGASLQIWRFNVWTVAAGFGLWGVVNGWFVFKHKQELMELFWKHWRRWLRVEIIFLLVTAWWATIRGFQPDINGLEKFMDFGFVNAIMQSQSFPPNDMWFAGGAINYYYFGHYLSAIMTMISGIKPAVAYNLMIATIFGLCVSEAMVIGMTLSNNIKNQISLLRQKAMDGQANIKNKGSLFISKSVVVGGMLTVFLLTSRGNLHTAGYYVNKWFGETGVMKLVHGQPTAVGDKKDFDCATGVNWLPCPDNPYWYPDATRYIPFTIHEFPIYSYVVADLHAHLINLPLVLMFVGGLIGLISRGPVAEWPLLGTKVRAGTAQVKEEELKSRPSRLLRRSNKIQTIVRGLWSSILWKKVGIFGGLLGIFAMTNAWDLPIYGMVLGMTWLLMWLWEKGEMDELGTRLWLTGGLGIGWLFGVSRFLVRINVGDEVGLKQMVWASLGSPSIWLTAAVLGGGWWLIWGQMNFKKQSQQLWESVSKATAVAVAALGIAMAVSLPFQLNFEQIAEGVRKVNTVSAVSQLLVLWGWDLFLFGSLVGFVIFRISNFKFLISKQYQNSNDQNKNKQILSNVNGQKSNVLMWDWWVLGLYLVGWFLVVLPEIIYVKDIYIADYHRANTMFKLVYQSWTLFAVAGGYTIVRLTTAWLSQKSEIRNPKSETRGGSYLKWGWVVLVVVGLVAVGSYPKRAIEGYYGKLEVYKGLDGEAWLKMRHPSDYAGIEWLRNTPTSTESRGPLNRGQFAPVVLEATGDSYTEFNRVSAYTGLPTVEGWLVHEWLWRGSFDEPGARGSVVEQIYNAQTLDERRTYSHLEEGEVDKDYSVRELLKKYEVKYVFVGDKEREKYPELNEAKFGEIGEVGFEEGNTHIYEIK